MSGETREMTPEEIAAQIVGRKRPRAYLANDLRMIIERAEKRALWLAERRIDAIPHPCHEVCFGDLHADCQCAAWMRQEARAALVSEEGSRTR